jgi:acyl carrier protein
MQAETIRSIVLETIRHTNVARLPANQLTVRPDAPIFGPDSRLDSLGLVALLIDLEEAFAKHGVEINLSDERAMSQRHSPFRTVITLVDYIEQLTSDRR